MLRKISRGRKAWARKSPCTEATSRCLRSMPSSMQVGGKWFYVGMAWKSFIARISTLRAWALESCIKLLCAVETCWKLFFPSFSVASVHLVCLYYEKDYSETWISWSPGKKIIFASVFWFSLYSWDFTLDSGRKLNFDTKLLQYISLFFKSSHL